MAISNPNMHFENCDLHITYVDKEGPFIKLFAQTDKNACLVEKLLYQLRVKLETTPELGPKMLSDLKIGLICCAKFEDGNYYRAQIQSLENMKDYKVAVFFIDHGNCAEVNVMDIRLNSKILLLFPNAQVKQILELPNLAREFFLSGVASIKDWEESTLDILRKKLSNTDMLCSVCEIGGEKIIYKVIKAIIDPVNLLTNTNSIDVCQINFTVYVKTLIEKKSLQVSLPIQFNIPPPTVVDLTKQPPPSRMPNLNQPPPVRMISEVNSLQRRNQPLSGRFPGNVPLRPGIPGIQIRRPEMSATLPPAQSLQFSTEMLAVGVTHLVFVSHVEDGPHSFAIQIQNEVQDILMKMMTDINNHEPLPITAPLNPGSICLGRYSVDGSLCRAIVMNVIGDKVKLYFADFGNSEILPYSEIYQIPPQFVEPKVISHRFTLANIKDMLYTEQQKQLFKNLVANISNLQIRVAPPEANPLKQYCDLFLNCKNIKVVMEEMLQSMPPLRYVSVQLPRKGSREEVFVPFVLNPGRFFVQLEKNSEELRQIMSLVAEHCRTASHIPLSNIRAGDPCCALYEDQTWYRAEILKVYPDKVFINFVDYGNQEEVEHVNLRQITADLVLERKAQALVCCLKGYETKYNVSEDISNRLEELVLEKNLSMHVVGSTESNGVLIVQLSDNGQDIWTLLDAYQATATAATITPAPKAIPAAPAATNDGWGESAPSSNREEPNYTDSRGPSDEGAKPWRSQQDGNTSSRFNREGRRNDGPPFEKRYNKEEEDKAWNQGESRFNKDDNRGGRFNREEEGGGRFNRDRDDGKTFGERKGRFNDDNKGGRFGDSESRGGRFGDSESRGGKFNSTDEEKPWRKKDDDSGGRKSNRDDGGSWKPRDNNDGGSGGGWKDRDGASGGGWKGRDGGSSGGWRDGGGDRKSTFDSNSDFKRGGSFNRDSGDRSSSRKPWEKGSGDTYGKPAPKSQKPDTLGGIPYSTVKVGITENSQVVFTTSTAEFYIQLNSSAEELNQLMDKIATACESGEATDMTFVQDKTACLAKYSEDDAWYRGFIEEKSFDSTKVQFVDYGNQENVPLDKIKNLPEDMSSLPAQAVKCRLYGVPETAEMDAFSALTTDKTLQTQFIAKHFLTKSFQVVLIDEESGSNINIAMGAEEEEVLAALSKMSQSSPTVPRYPAGTVLTVQVTWYRNPSEFYVQPMASHPEFRAMMQSMQTIVKSGSVRQNNQLTIGDFVIARFKADKVLYRALVKETGFAPTVQYLDYGNTEPVDSGSVWAMEPEYATLPVQAFSCSLAGVLPNGEAWPQADTTGLDQHFEADTLECSVVKEAESQYVVKLVKDGEDVAAKIIEDGFAVSCSDVGVASELDTALLVGHILPVTLLRVEDDSSFFVQPPAEDIELHSLEAVAGEGIKCTMTGVREDASEEQLAQWKQLPANTNINVLVDAVQNDGLQVTVYDADGQLLPLQVSETATVDKICPLPVLNTHQRVWIAHASEDGVFLHKVVFGDQLAELLQKLFEVYNESEQVDQEWTECEMCCAKSVNDKQWYRARILETGTEAKVQYIDYGNSETVPVSNLRKLDPAFYTPHAFALKVALHVSWSVPVDNLLELSTETEYNAVVLRSGDGWIVELVDTSGQSLTEKLVELGFAVALENSPFQRVVEGGRFVESSDVSVAPTFIDSPLQLWVCVGDDLELVEALQDRLQEAAPKLASLKEPTGMFAAKFSDDLWYRAIKINETTVRFVDYGNSDTVDMSDIKELSADFLEPAEGYAVKVELPVADFKEEATERLNQLLLSEDTDLEGEIMAHILSVIESYIVADISKGGKSVVDILVGENLCTRLQKITSGFVSHIKSLNDFYIQEVGCEEALETIANIMLTAESFEPITEIVVGNLVAALYAEEGLWYRAKVTEKSEDVIKILFIDFGNSAVATEFRTLPSDLASIAPLSKHCTLQLPIGVVEWSQSAVEKFIELSADGGSQFDVKLLNNESPATVLLTSNGKCISEELKSLCDVIEKEIVGSENTSIDQTGYNTTVYISHINSFKDFYVQEEGAEAELDVIKEELGAVSSFETVDQITDEVTKEILGALFVDDDSWYRARILDIVEGGSKVLFIDYGNTAVATKFVKLPETLLNKPPVATHCTLGREDWPEIANSTFVTLADEGNTACLMKVMKEGEPQIVSLIIDNKKVDKEFDRMFGLPSKEEISKENKVSFKIPEETVTGIGKGLDESLIKTVYLIKVNSPDDFFLHSAEATQQVAEISEQLVEAEGFTHVELSSVAKGENVAAQFEEDDLWYRAKIIDKSETETKVLFIDYGNTAKVAKMKHLPDELLAIPPLAMHCSLLRPEDNEWSPKALETFNKLANDEGVTFELRIVSEGEPNIVELYINGESVAEQIVLVTGLVSENHSDEETEDLPNEARSETILDKAPSIDEGLIQPSTETTDEHNDNETVDKLTEDHSVNLCQSDTGEQNEIETIIFQSVEQEILNSLKKDMKEITEELVCNVQRKIDENKEKEMQQLTDDLELNDQDEISENKEKEMQQITDDLELNDQDEISENKEKEMQQITDAVVLNALDGISTNKEVQQVIDEDDSVINAQDDIIENKEIEMRQITDDLILNVQDKISEKEVKEMQQISNDLLTKSSGIEEVQSIIEVSNKQTAKESKSMKEASEVGLPDVLCDSQSPNKENDPMTVLNTSNGVDKDTDEDERDDTVIETWKVCSKSPSASRRSNIDEQIVPGCISLVKPEDSPGTS